MDRKQLVETLKKVEPALAARNEIPVLASFCFNGETVHAFNKIIALVCPCRTEFKGAVQGRLFLDSLALSRADTAEFSVEAETLTVKVGKSKLETPLLAPEEFQFQSPEKGKGKALKVDEKWLAALAVAAAGMGRKLGGAVWQYGVTLDICDGGCIFYATDNRTITRVTAGKPGKVEFSVILLPEFVDALLNAAKGAAPKGIVFSPQWVQAFFNGGLRLFSITMEGASSKSYRDITDSFLTKPGPSPDIPAELSLCLQRAQLAFSHATENPHTELTIKDNFARFKTPSPVGEKTDVMKLPHSPITLKVRPDDLLRGLERGKKISLFESCVRFSAPGYLFLVSPINF